MNLAIQLKSNNHSAKNIDPLSPQHLFFNKFWKNFSNTLIFSKNLLCRLFVSLLTPAFWTLVCLVLFVNYTMNCLPFMGKRVHTVWEIWRTIRISDRIITHWILCIHVITVELTLSLGLMSRWRNMARNVTCFLRSLRHKIRQICPLNWLKYTLFIYSFHFVYFL